MSAPMLLLAATPMLLALARCRVVGSWRNAGGGGRDGGASDRWKLLAGHRSSQFVSSLTRNIPARARQPIVRMQHERRTND